MGQGQGQGLGLGSTKGEVVDQGFAQMSLPDLLKWVMDSVGPGSTSCRPEVSKTELGCFLPIFNMDRIRLVSVL